MNVAALAQYKARLKVARGELTAARASVLPFTEVAGSEVTSEQMALATVARGVSAIAGVLIRIIDSLPGGHDG